MKEIMYLLTEWEGPDGDYSICLSGQLANTIIFFLREPIGFMNASSTFCSSLSYQFVKRSFYLQTPLSQCHSIVRVRKSSH